MGRRCSHGCECIQCFPFGLIADVVVVFEHLPGNVACDAEDGLSLASVDSANSVIAECRISWNRKPFNLL